MITCVFFKCFFKKKNFCQSDVIITIVTWWPLPIVYCYFFYNLDSEQKGCIGFTITYHFFFMAKLSFSSTKIILYIIII